MRLWLDEVTKMLTINACCSMSSTVDCNTFVLVFKSVIEYFTIVITLYFALRLSRNNFKNKVLYLKRLKNLLTREI